MAGTEEIKFQENEDSFQWDEQSQLYYHASSGFYHDSSAGWYYSSKDGHYYKFENGNYVLWESDQAEESNANEGLVSVDDECFKHAPCDKDTNNVSFEDGEIEGCVAGEVTPNEPIVDTECSTDALCENMPPPSEWLEDTLIEIYLSGYSNQTADGASGARALDNDPSLNISTDGVDNDNADELEEGEWVPDETHEVVDGCGVASDEDAFAEEEVWRAQYGQTVHLDKVLVPNCPVVDLWDWEMIKETKRRRKICRLVGRLVKRSSKLHPSMPASGRVLKTAPICEVYLDLVRVRSGKVYKLRSPKVVYLASLSSYDSSNPTKDWGFPKLSMEKETGCHIESKMEGARVEEVESAKELSSKSAEELSSNEKNKGHTYRDRAAERRTLHGGFGVGPGQKKSTDGVDYASSSPVSANPEEAAAEALEMSFGVGSYARRLLENMGWKEGEALGSSMKGLTEPLEAVGNKGSTGLGWNHNTRWNRI